MRCKVFGPGDVMVGGVECLHALHQKGKDVLPRVSSRLPALGQPCSQIEAKACLSSAFPFLSMVDTR